MLKNEILREMKNNVKKCIAIIPIVCYHRVEIEYFDNSKPAEKQGRKAKGLRSDDYDSRLPNVELWGSGSIQATEWGFF